MSILEKLLSKTEEMIIERIKNIVRKLFSSEKKEENCFNFDLYKITFKCQDQLIMYQLTRNEIIEQLRQEFQGHINYFRWDVRDYPFPLKINYIVQLDKNEREIVIKNIYRCTENQMQLVDWNTILSVYRQLTRYKYRTYPNEIIRNRALALETSKKHSDLKNLLMKYYKKYYNFSVDFELNCSTPTEKSMFLELCQSAECLMRVDDTMRDYKKEVISPEDMKIAVITELEKSLQHLHKIIVLYPPKQEYNENG